jgi:hypothetical protein
LQIPVGNFTEVTAEGREQAELLLEVAVGIGAVVDRAEIQPIAQDTASLDLPAVDLGIYTST